jgi:hypothetical protein
MLPAGPTRPWKLHEIFSVLNPVAAVTCVFFAYAARNLSALQASSEAGFWYLRAAVRLSDAIGHPLPHPLLSDSNVMRSELLFGQAAMLLSFVAAAAIGLALLFSLRGTTAHRLWMKTAGVIGVIVPPLALLIVVRATWTFDDHSMPPEEPFSRSILLWVFYAELACIAGLLFIQRRRTFSRGFVGALLLLHYAFWLPLFWGALPDHGYDFRSAILFVAILPASAIAWLLSFGTRAEDAPAPPLFIRGLTLASAVMVLLGLWGPRPARRLAKLDDVVVTLRRTGCFGACAAYDLTVRGDGQVKYAGQMFVEDKGPRTSQIDAAKARDLIQALDDLRFTAIEDRAFPWCYDTSKLAITVSAPGVEKRVMLDADCSGPRGGIQEKVVLVADQMDKATNSRQWVGYSHRP